MVTRLKGLGGRPRRRVIAIIAGTRAEVEVAAAHALTSGSGLPLIAWCAEQCGSEPVEGCDRFTPGALPGQIRSDLASLWPALTIVAWTGRRHSSAIRKLLPFTIPPFRVLVLNEAGDFFQPTPTSLRRHAARRFRDASESAARRGVDWTRGFGQWFNSLQYRFRETAANALLAVLAVAAIIAVPLARRAVRRANSANFTEPSAPPPPSPCGADFIELSFSNRSWPRRQIVKAVAETNAAFLVFRWGDETADANPLIRAAIETNAFAVARQSAWAGWRRQVITRHPFRKLQPEESTQVLAPYSTLFVIRRDLLLRFGVPRAMTYGAALLIMHWKAASAGLRSIVVGHGGSITQEPDMHLEDVEFAARLIASRALRGSSPLYPNRLRGNISSSHRHRRMLRGKPRVLVVSPYLPFPLSHGGAVRMYNLCRALSSDIDFTLACYREANQTVHYDELHKVFRDVYVLDNDEKHADAAVPLQAAEYRNTAMDDLIRRLCLAREVDLVQLEFTQMAEFRDQTGAVPVILVEHDITFSLYRQLARALPDPAARLQYELWLSFERTALQCSNAVWTMSEQDRLVALQYGAPRRATTVVPNGVDLERFQPWGEPEGAPVVLFVGSFRHLPNLLAFEALRQTIMPLVWGDLPDATLHVIAGPDHTRAAQMAGKVKLLSPDPRIVLQGFVDDVRPAYRDAHVVVIPLPVSAGTNIKVMEAMACRRAIVSTIPGCQGLGLQDGEDLMIRNLGEEFAGAVTHLLWNPQMRQKLASTARRTAEIRFGWDAIARQALASYRTLLSETIASTADRVSAHH